MISLPNSKLKARWIRLIIFVLIFSTLIHFTRLKEAKLYSIFLLTVASDSYAAYEELTPLQKLVVYFRRIRGRACG